MIASLTGRVAHVGLERVVIEVGGVGMVVGTPPRTAAALRTGADATLATTLVVREDSLTLFGFETPDERDMFETVQTVSGVGPRLALALLSVHGPDDIRRAIGAGDIAALTKVPGIGKKGAERMCLELRDRIGAPAGAAEAGGVPVGAAPTGSQQREQVLEALTGLGWTAKQAGDTVERVAATFETPPAVAELLRACLRELGR
ncbi:MAG: Holliday junction branch migration protein RuvA [Micrococcales bacterium]|nr:Holliday junction branch migration protein RuvA [Micrococcales bacterium]